MGLFEENIFEETFRKAIEEKNPSSSTSFLRRTISIQNEDTLHTPQIPLHFYKSESAIASECTKASSDSTIIDVECVDKAAKDPSPKVSRERPRRPKRKKPGRDDLFPTNSIVPVSSTVPVDFPDEIKIQPKWTVLLQYPAYETTTSDPPSGTQIVKERLQALLVKNETSKLQTVSLTQPRPIALAPDPQIVGNLLMPVVNVHEVRTSGEQNPVKTTTRRRVTNVERNNEAARRYRNKKKSLFDSLRQRNEQLEEENRKLKLENKQLAERLAQVLKEDGKGVS